MTTTITSSFRPVAVILQFNTGGTSKQQSSDSKQVESQKQPPALQAPTQHPGSSPAASQVPTHQQENLIKVTFA